MTNEPITRSSRGSVIAAVVSWVVAVALTALTVVVVVTSKLQHVPEATPDTSREQLLAAIRLTDADLAQFGMEASESGLQPSTLGTAVTKVQYEWRNVQGEPEECLFAGWSPGTSVYPVTGEEAEDDPLWKEKVISGTQSLTFNDEPYLTVTARVFDDEATASAHLATWDDLVPGCTQFASEHGQILTTTSIAPLRYEELGAANSGWIASTPEWNVSYSGLAPQIVAVEMYVLEIQQENAVVRVTMFVVPDPDNREGFLQIADVVSENLASALR